MRMCSAIGCERKAHGKNLCNKHYLLMLRNKRPMGKTVFLHDKPWVVAGCLRPYSAKGMCGLHYQRSQRGALLA